MIFLAIQKSLKSLLWHHNSKASIFQCSAFLIIQHSHPYMTTGKTIALTIWTFGAKLCLFFLILYLGLAVFLPHSKCLLISWLQSPSAVIWEPKKIKSVTVFTFSSSICHEVIKPDAMILIFFLNVESQASFYTFLFYPHQQTLQFLFSFCH